jgi:hypothetical protein
MVKVELALYDLSRGMAFAMSQQILGQRIDGIWHTGIVVYGYEWFFGGGIQCLPYGAFASQNGMQPVQLLFLGDTSKTMIELQSFLQSIRNQFSMATYDLLNNNCNNFSDTVSRFLLNGQGIPSHIVDLPRIVFSTPGGQMLRPMIENMQQAIRQQNGSGMDPFGHSNQTVQGSFESNLANNLRDGVIASAVPTSVEQRIKSIETLSFESKPLVSEDRSSLDVLVKKMISIKNESDKPIFNENEISMIDSILRKVSNPTNQIISKDELSFLFRIAEQIPKCQMYAYFVLRIVMVYESLLPHESIYDLIKTFVLRLKSTIDKNASEIFSSVTGHVMALCTLSNMLSQGRCKVLLMKGDDLGATVGTGLSTDIADIAMNGLTNARVEVRQMSAAIAYNLTLCHVVDDCGGFNKCQDDEDPGPLVQLLCGCIENIESETDITTRVRRLRVLALISFYCKGNNLLASLAQDLGLPTVIRSMNSVELKRSSDQQTLQLHSVVHDLACLLQV